MVDTMKKLELVESTGFSFSQIQTQRQAVNGHWIHKYEANMLHYRNSILSNNDDRAYCI